VNSQLISMDEREDESKEENEYEYIDFGPEEEGTTYKYLLRITFFIGFSNLTIAGTAERSRGPVEVGQ
jgi:hypothetical protein